MVWGIAMDLMFFSAQNAYVEALTVNATVLGDEAFGR